METLLIMLAATALSFVLHEFFIQNNNVSMIYALAVVVVSCITPGYFYGVLASLISVIGVNYFFTMPYWAFNFSLTGYPLTFFIMLITSIITSTLVPATARGKGHGRRGTRKSCGATFCGPYPTTSGRRSPPYRARAACCCPAGRISMKKTAARCSAIYAIIPSGS